MVNLCHETGALCETNRLNLKVTASVCISRATHDDDIIILTPCGVCQDRLAAWGMDVEVAVPDAADPTKSESKQLKEVQPYFWKNIL